MKTSWRRLEDVFRRRLQKTSSRRLDQGKYSRLTHTSSKDVFKTSLSRPTYSSWPYVLKTSSGRFQDVLQKRLQDIFKTSSKDFFKTFSRRTIRLSCLPRSRICLGHTSEKFIENLKVWYKILQSFRITLWFFSFSLYHNFYVHQLLTEAFSESIWTSTWELFCEST